MKLLYIEDDEKLARNTSASLRKAGFAVDAVPTGGEAIHRADGGAYDVVILDLGLPDMDGMAVLERLKHINARLPVIICTARDGLGERIRGLVSGADDYLVKPFDFDSLLARIRAVLRLPGGAMGQVLVAGKIRMNTLRRSVEIAGEPVGLSRQESDILECFMRAKGRVLTCEAIGAALETPDGAPTAEVAESMALRLIEKLDALGASVPIHALRGVGFMMEDDGT